MKRWRPFKFFGIALILSVCSLLLAQGGFTLKVDVSLIPLDAAVYDAAGNPVMTLTRDDFLVYEDGVLQEIQHFEAADAPYNILLLFDTSGSTKGQIGFMVDAGNRFLINFRGNDHVALATFTVGVTKLLDWKDPNRRRTASCNPTGYRRHRPLWRAGMVLGGIGAARRPEGSVGPDRRTGWKALCANWGACRLPASSQGSRAGPRSFLFRGGARDRSRDHPGYGASTDVGVGRPFRRAGAVSKSPQRCRAALRTNRKRARGVVWPGLRSHQAEG